MSQKIKISKIFLFTPFIVLSQFSCSSILKSRTNKTSEKSTQSIMNNYKIRWDFNTLAGWVDGSQNMKGLVNYHINKGELNISTRANTWDRPKIRTFKKKYKTGKYTWKVYVPKLGMGDMASIGAFIYNDDKHELDFEIGYGATTVRDSLDVAPDEVIAYMTSQALPFQSIPTKIKREQWHVLEIELIKNKNKYEAIWYINNTEKSRLSLNYGDQFSFYIFCSVENLKFIGDHIPFQDNYGVFDYVQFEEY